MDYDRDPAAAARITLKELAETERSSGFSLGMGLTESMLRVDAGDYGRAMIAAYKELSWMYAYGGGLTPEHILNLTHKIEHFPIVVEDVEFM